MRTIYFLVLFKILAVLGGAGVVFASDLSACTSSGYFHNCFGTYTFENGDKYVGEFRDNTFNGQGTYTFSDGDKYVGEFKDDKKDGQGTYTFSDGDKYVGEFKDDKRDGQGTYYFLADNEFKGDKYVGEFKDDKRDGQGTYYFLADNEFKGDKYVGEYKDNEGEGQGAYYFANGRRDVGEFKDGVLNGYAIQYRADGSILKEGIFEDDEFLYASKDPQKIDLPACPSSGYFHNCFGTYTFENGDKYVGEYKDNEGEGQGAYYFADGRRDVGEFKDGVLNGYAIQYRADGSILKEGIFEDDEFLYASKDPQKIDLPACPSSEYLHNCFGTYTFENGDKYVGEFRDNTFNGQGTYTFSDGDKYVGEFKDDKRDGQGTYYFLADNEFKGDKYVGEFKDDKRDGQGTYYFLADNEFKGDKYVGEYKDNEGEGQGAYYFANGHKYVGEFRVNIFHGQGTYTFPDGRRDVGEFKDGVLNGYAIQYRADGSILKEGIFEDDEFLYAQKVTPEVPIVKAPKKSDEIISASSGSGFAVSSNGYVITNYHVVEGCEKIVVHTKENDFPTKVITYDTRNDLALLKGDFRPETVLALSNSRPELLQDVYVAGFPFGDKFSTSVKVTRGIVSSLTGLGNNFSNIQIDAALQSGNSGGPIIDHFGNVVGVAVAKLDAKYMFEEFGIIPENTNFGIKSSVVRSVLESNNIDIPSANKLSISKSQLGKMISNGTYYISCWMSMAQINKMKSKKVFFNNVD